MVLGMSTACFFSRLLTEDAVVRISEMGIKNIEVFLCCLTEYRLPFIKELKKRVIDYGIKVSSVHALSVQFEPQLFSSHPRARKDAYDILDEVLEAACYLEADLYTFHGIPNLKRAKKPVYDFMKIAENASKVAEKAREHSVKLAWENVHWCLFSDTDFLSGLLRQDLSDNLYFTLDIKQAAQAKVKPEDFIYGMGKRLANIHLCDFISDPEKGIVTRLPFDGVMDFQSFKTALELSGYDGPLIYEVYASDYESERDLELNYIKTAAFFQKA